MGAAVPQQVPGYDLPGAEYFSLAPQHTIALSGRRRYRFTQPSAVTVPASATNFEIDLIGQIENPFVDTQGIYVHKFDYFVSPQSGGLSVVSTLGGLNRRTTSTNFADYPLGYLALTSLQLPAGALVLTDRNILVAGRDVGAGINQPGFQANVLNVAAFVLLSNALATPVLVTTVIQIVYTKLDGLTE